MLYLQVALVPSPPKAPRCPMPVMELMYSPCPYVLYLTLSPPKVWTTNELMVEHVSMLHHYFLHSSLKVMKMKLISFITNFKLTNFEK